MFLFFSRADEQYFKLIYNCSKQTTVYLSTVLSATFYIHSSTTSYFAVSDYSVSVGYCSWHVTNQSVVGTCTLRVRHRNVTDT